MEVFLVGLSGFRNCVARETCSVRPGLRSRQRPQKISEVFADVRLASRYGTKFHRKQMQIARKWLPVRNDFPAPRPTAHFVWHKQMPVLDKSQVSEAPPRKLDMRDTFCIN